ncbi:MAG: hypothetical protein HZA47_09155 [Planctomycetes bacterium]|uniref:hypothetical protein n=1 Tax=Candidatus Wunengus sp. YC65 TaxID=3367701 RepID=UPI001DFC2063|nr:hypothetical protein [Planctomycetota bacterium]
MKKYLIGVFIFLFVAAFSSAYEVFAQETYDFDGTIQVKVGKKKLKEDVSGTVDITMTEEEEFIKKGNAKSSHDDSGGGSAFESATFNFEFGTEDTECGDTLDEEEIEVDAEPQEDGGGGSKTNVRIELDQNSMTDVIARILEKNGATVQEALDLDDCFSTTGGGEQIVDFWVNYVSGTAYIKSTYIKISFSGNAEIQISDQDYQNQKRYKQRISGKLIIPLE